MRLSGPFRLILRVRAPQLAHRWTWVKSGVGFVSGTSLIEIPSAPLMMRGRHAVARWIPLLIVYFHIDSLQIFAKGTLDFFPDNADELDAVSHLFSYRNSVCAEVLCLTQSKGRNAAGVLQPPILRRLGVTRRCHVFAHLVEVVRLGWGCGYVELFYVFGSNVNDLIDILQRPFH